MRLSRTLAAAALIAVMLPSEGSAQIRASEPSTVTQTIDGTVFTIDYYRPRTRDRSPLFGKDAVVWEDPWTPGANWATTLSFQNPITFEGVQVEPGTYSIWMDMSEDEFLPETLILDPGERLFHTTPPEERAEQIRFPIEREEAPFVDVLTWGFEELRTDGGTLALRWGTMRMAFDIKVEPSMRVTVTQEEAAPIEGTWDFVVMGPGGQMADPIHTVITLGDDEHLHLDFQGITGDPMGPGTGPWMEELDMWLLPFAERIFAPSEAYDGVLWEVWEGMFFEFNLVDGRSTEFELRGPDDEVMARGTRKD
jgi:hypothetical protein